MIASQAYSDMQQYSEALELLSNQFTLSTSQEVLEMKKSLNAKLEEQNNLIESKYALKIHVKKKKNSFMILKANKP